MSKRQYTVDLTDGRRKIIVGEGESDLKFFSHFCSRNGIDGFHYAFTGMHGDDKAASSFDRFVAYLPRLYNLANFDALTDVVLACDSAANPDKQFAALCKQVIAANKSIGSPAFTSPDAYNVTSPQGAPRVHVLIIPHGRPGGLESICFDVLKDHLNGSGKNGTEIEGWVNEFADKACVGWSVEKRDKLRLQALISAAQRSKPEMHLSQLFDITGDHLIPLDSPSFGDVRAFLTAVAAL